MTAVRRASVPRRFAAPSAPYSRLGEREVHAWHRRLRAGVFWFRRTSGILPPPPGIAPLRDSLGRVRDVDAALHELERWTREDAPRGLGSKVRNARRALRTDSTRRRARLRRFLRTHPNAPSAWTPLTPRPRTALLEHVRRGLLTRLRRAQRRALDRPSRRRLHRVRKRIRELGLLAEMAEARPPNGTPRLRANLRRLMQDLGRSNDRAVLIRWLRRRSARPDGGALVRALQRSQRRDCRATLQRLSRIEGSDWASWTALRLQK
jgi:hypothetical protein